MGFNISLLGGHNSTSNNNVQYLTCYDSWLWERKKTVILNVHQQGSFQSGLFCFHFGTAGLNTVNGRKHRKVTIILQEFAREREREERDQEREREGTREKESHSLKVF